MSDELPHAHGGPPLAGRLRATPEDFRVEELLGFEPSGSGEHAFLTVEKRGANTEWVARRLAAHAGIGPAAVGYAGLKDRHAVARQYFTVHLPGRADPDWLALSDPEFRVVAATRHARKLPRGALAGNRFVLVLRELRGERALAESRLDALARRGAPNYFGEQRFGRDEGNLARARAMFAGRRVGPHERGLLLSAARSAIFNRLLAARVAAGTWDVAQPGDVFQFDRGGSVFGPAPDDPSVAERVGAGTIHPTGPLWGKGALPTAGAIAEAEAAAAAVEAGLADGLVRAGVEAQRRALRLLPAAMAWDWVDAATLRVEFALGKGAYATALLREVLVWQATPQSAQ